MNISTSVTMYNALSFKDDEYDSDIGAFVTERQCLDYMYDANSEKVLSLKHRLLMWGPGPP